MKPKIFLFFILFNACLFGAITSTDGSLTYDPGLDAWVYDFKVSDKSVMIYYNCTAFTSTKINCTATYRLVDSTLDYGLKCHTEFKNMCNWQNIITATGTGMFTLPAYASDKVYFYFSGTGIDMDIAARGVETGFHSLHNGAVNIDENSYISTYLTNGGSSGMGVDGSVTPIDFCYTPPAGKSFLLLRAFIWLKSGTDFSDTTFAHLTALTNGVQVLINGTVVTNWQTNTDIVLEMYDHIGGDALAKTKRAILGRWSFFKDTGDRPFLITDTGGGVCFRIRDDLDVAGLEMKVKIKGFLILE